MGIVSAWYHRNYRGRELGLIHWIAVRPAHQGLGLGRAAMSYALHQLAQWHDRAGLGTQTKRIRAIKLYLDFGFRPDLERPGALESWRKVKAELDHPRLEALEWMAAQHLPVEEWEKMEQQLESRWQECDDE